MILLAFQDGGVGDFGISSCLLKLPEDALSSCHVPMELTQLTQLTQLAMSQDSQLQMGLDWGRFRHRLELAFQQLGKEERLGSAGRGQREGAP